FPASVRELMNVYKLMESFSTEEISIVPTHELRIPEVAHAYNVSESALAEKPETWLRTARSPFNYYDLYNWTTYQGNNPNLRVSDRQRIREYGGSMLDTRIDMAMYAPDVKFGEPWLVSPN
ncbi:MAG TPA: hypothetical protein VEF04_02865, partial [Blastocatellia bacterium]|nr:hypothetical protein [Blastocatellia bacterium]